MKSPLVKIIQIIWVVEKQLQKNNIHGLGDDGNVYKWEPRTREWHEGPDFI